MNDEMFMREAIRQAKKASSIGEVPIGAVIVMDGKIIARSYNRRETDKNALSHAEIIAIDRACRKLGGWRLWKCELYVTLEPCPMCAGAIVNSRIRRVIYGAPDPKAGCYGNVCDFNSLAFNHKPEVVAGVLAEECSDLLTVFFRSLRKVKKSKL